MLLIEAERRSPTTTYYQGAGQRGTVSLLDDRSTHMDRNTFKVVIHVD